MSTVVRRVGVRILREGPNEILAHHLQRDLRTAVGEAEDVEVGAAVVAVLGRCWRELSVRIPVDVVSFGPFQCNYWRS